jgi:hypothetical protein
MDELKKAGREIGTDVKKAGREADGHQWTDDVKNTADDIRTGAANLGDDLRHGSDRPDADQTYPSEPQVGDRTM